MSPEQRIWIALARLKDVSPEMKTRLLLVYYGRKTLTKELLPYARRMTILAPQVRQWRIRHRSYIRARDLRRKERRKMETTRVKNRGEGTSIRELVHSVATRRGLFSVEKSVGLKSHIREKS